MIIYIPIKEKSQRVPGKNLRLLNKTPLYMHCLYKLKDFKVYVDTDSTMIINSIQKNTDEYN